MAAVIASVDHRLRAMLGGDAKSKAYLQKGAAFEDLPSSRDPDGLKCSRLDDLVAHLCNVGVRAVRAPVGGLLRHTIAASFFQQRASCVV